MKFINIALFAPLGPSSYPAVQRHEPQGDEHHDQSAHESGKRGLEPPAMTDASRSEPQPDTEVFLS